MSYSSEVLADSPLGYWRLGESSGTTMADASGNSRDGTYSGVTLGTTGLLTGDSDTAVTINGSTARGEVTSASWMDAASFTIEAWVKTSTTGVYQYVVNRDTAGRLWEYRIQPTGNLEFEKIASGFQSTVTSGLTLNDGNTHHVVATYDGTNVRLYVDGLLNVTGASTSGSMTGSVANLAIGATFAGTGSYGPHRFIGVIDEVAYYGTALSGTRIAAHYTAGSTAPGGASVSPPAATATASAAVPAVSASSTVAPPAATATASAPVPSISTGTNATVAPPAATATASAPAPVITQVIPAATDTTNFLNGRNRRARASVTVTRPVGAAPSNLATKVDKAVPLPPPTLVDGRVQ